MSQNISDLHLPGITSNISSITQCTPALCSMEYATVTYVPTLYGNALFGVIFVLFFFIQLLFLCVYRTWSFSCAMCAGLAMEVVGYYGRVAMHYNVFNNNPFLINIICLTIAPIFFTAAIYLTLARVIVHYGKHNSRLSPRAYSLTFMSCDLIALILQSVGGAMADTAKTRDASITGVHIMVGGLSFQVVSLVCFMSLAAEFFFRIRKDRLAVRATNWASGKVEAPPAEIKGLKAFIYAFTLATIFILIRSAYRVAELAHGFSSKLANDQVTFMIFEGALMVCALTLLTVFQPGRCIGRDGWKNSGWRTKSKHAEEAMRPLSPAMQDGEGNWRVEYRGVIVKPTGAGVGEGVYMREWPIQS